MDHQYLQPSRNHNRNKSRDTSPPSGVPILNSVASENLSEKIQKILEADHRTDYEGSLLFEEIKHFQFFETFNELNVNNYFEKNAFIHICKKAKYEKFPAGKVVFNQRDPSNGKLYLIYSGEVSIVTHGPDYFVGPPPVQIPDAPSSKGDVNDSKSNVSNTPTAKGESTPSTTSILKDSKHESPATPEPKSFAKIVKSKFAGVTALRTRSRKTSPQDKDTPTSANETTFVTTQKEPLKKRQPSQESHLSQLSNLSGVHNQSQDGVSVRGSFRARRMTRLKTNPEDVENPETLEKPRTLSLQSKLRAVTKLTLTTIRLGKIVGGLCKDPQEAASFRKESFDSFVKKYGKVQNKIERGGYFGEKALLENTPRSATVICNTDCQFLVVNKRDFNFVQKNFDCKRKQVIKFMIDFIPDIENITAHEAVERLMYLLQERNYERGNYIVNEGDKGDKLYILFEGSCEIVKNLKIDESSIGDNQYDLQKLLRSGQTQHQQIAVCKVQKGVFFGEEILYNNRNSYSFSLRVSSAFAKVFTISKESFVSKFPSASQAEVKRAYNSKASSYADIIKDLLETRYPEMTLTQTFNTSKELNSFIVNGRLVIRPKTFADLRRIQVGSDTPVGSRQEESRSIEARSRKGKLTLDQESALLNQSVDLGCLKTDKNCDVMQIKKYLYPYMRSIVSPSQVGYLQKNRLTSAQKPTKIENSGKDENKDVIEIPKAFDTIYKDTKTHGDLDLMRQTTYISSIMNMTGTLERYADQARGLGLRIDLRDEVCDTLTHDLNTPGTNPTERTKRRSVDEVLNPISLDINTEELLGEDKRAIRSLQIKKKMITMKKQPYPSIPANGDNNRLETLFKRAQRKIKRNVFLDRSIIRTGHTRIPEMENFQLSSETLNMTLSSPTKPERHRVSDIERMLRTDMESFETKNFSPRARISKRMNYSYQFQGDELFTMTRFMSTERCKEEEAAAHEEQEKYNALQQQLQAQRSAKKEETHGSRLKKKHKIRQQLKSKRDRDSLQTQPNSICVPAVNKSLTTKNVSTSFQI